ncbi:MAG: hypothetical protein BWY85_01976 [Firmicutes bacterium ADurb.Bin506]|nr:MAG: hypothetical protein BWY85_01976 [Firmicutes bacterium ADurb.Bin506]
MSSSALARALAPAITTRDPVLSSACMVDAGTTDEISAFMSDAAACASLNTRMASGSGCGAAGGAGNGTSRLATSSATLRCTEGSASTTKVFVLASI